jgi:pimeloyl-ACP methyl ester carboxylesterase
MSKCIILLHGNSASSKYMMPIIPYLDGYETILNLDLAMHGQNKEPVKRLSVEYCSEQVWKTMQDQEIDSADFIGYSDGANVILRLAQDHPNVVGKAVLLSPTTRTRAMHLHWVILISSAFFMTWLIRYIPALNRVHQRMRMMLFYRLAERSMAGDFSLYFAERDMITKEDQHRVENLLGIKSKIVVGANHFNLVKKWVANYVLIEFS